MLIRLIIKNFKCIPEADIALSGNVVFVGPNNSGKTTALQALALWDTALKAWLSRRGNNPEELKRSGVAINRRDITALPIPNALYLWKDLHTREVTRKNDKQQTKNVLIEIAVKGITESGINWECGFEFDYANPESFYCRPLRLDAKGDTRMPLPDNKILEELRIVFLPPMSGLATVETKRESGEINVLIGEGQTAQVMRNLCYMVYKNTDKWSALIEKIQALFGIKLLEPIYSPMRSEIAMQYIDRANNTLDLSCSGRGLQQTLLIAAYLYANPHAVILLDEPDAHLEILRQRQIYQVIGDITREAQNQFIIASHSEVILNEAAEKDTVVAFTGKPHIINDRGQQLSKALREIGFEDYYLAEEKGWVLYLEGSTDLSILQTFALTLGHPVRRYLERPFVKFTGNNKPADAEKHFYALKEAYPALYGVALYDRITNPLTCTASLKETCWKKREIENYFCKRALFLEYARGNPEELFSAVDEQIMDDCITELENALKITGKPSPWSDDIKATDDFLDPLFRNFFAKKNLPHEIRKRTYYELAKLLPREQLDQEVTEKLDFILSIAQVAEMGRNNLF